MPRVPRRRPRPRACRRPRCSARRELFGLSRRPALARGGRRRRPSPPPGASPSASAPGCATGCATGQLRSTARRAGGNPARSLRVPRPLIEAPAAPGTGCGRGRSSAPPARSRSSVRTSRAHQLAVEEPGALAALVEAEAQRLLARRARRAPPRSAASSAGSPCPVRAEISADPRRARRDLRQRLGPRRRRAGRSCSRPRSCRACASSSTPSSPRIARTFSAWISLSGWAMSRTCRIRSASSTSSSVARKAATSWCGRSEMKPTVSDRMTRRPPGSSTARIVGSSVAKSMSFASTAAPVSRLNSVDLPALV